MRISVAMCALIAALALTAACTSTRQQSVALTGGDPEAGITAISHYGCGSCHTIPPVSGAHGKVGPSLSGVGARRIIAGQLPNTPENMTRWIQHPLMVNEKTAMPDLGVNDRDAQNIVALLYSLQQDQ